MNKKNGDIGWNMKSSLFISSIQQLPVIVNLMCLCVGCGGPTFTICQNYFLSFHNLKTLQKEILAMLKGERMIYILSG